jgi:hypothetical protein
VAEAEAKDHVAPRSMHFHPTSELLVSVDPDPDTSPRPDSHCLHFPPFLQGNASTKSCFGTRGAHFPGLRAFYLRGRTADLRSETAMSTTPRAIHLVDVENIFALTWGKPVSCLAGELYRSIASVGDGDLIEVAADVTRVFDTKAAFPGAQLRHGRGHDGADRALIENFDIDHAAKRFDTVVIGSGDHAFIDVAYRARQRGLNVVVVSRPASLSRALASYADLVIDVPEFEFAA